MEIDREKIVSKGNESIALGTIFGISAVAACPCPVCILGSVSMFANGIREKLGIEFPAAKGKCGKN
ncbi:MAG TPA: hypothetical protein PLO51_04400 [Candidatus Micrarchaeota archaeon]|nr:hypothetical protein [Candidatus Micrarchaeota archaeon]